MFTSKFSLRTLFDFSVGMAPPLLILFFVLGCLDNGTSPGNPLKQNTANPAEPGGGGWMPILEPGNPALSLPSPPLRGAEEWFAENWEIRDTQSRAAQEKESAAQYWDAGACLRWNEIARMLVIKHNTNPPMASRAYSALSVAQYDVLVDVWKNKYTYNRPAPWEEDERIDLQVKTPADPSYPSEHAAVAEASAEVLAYFYPHERDFLLEKAQAHAETRLWAGVSHRSDLTAGGILGKQAAASVVERAQADGHNAVFQGEMPAGEAYWVSHLNPPQPGLVPQWGKVLPWLMDPADSTKYMPGPPPSYGSEAFRRDLEEVRLYSDSRSKEQLRIALLWADGAGTYTPPGHWNEIACTLISENRMSELRAARALALMNMAVMDAGICCWAAKYKYCLIRPSQVDPAITTPVGLPNFPSYTSGHSSFSGAAATVLGYLFPKENESLAAMADEAAMSRVYGGIHYRFDSDAGLVNGRSMGELAIQRARQDGADQ